MEICLIFGILLFNLIIDVPKKMKLPVKSLCSRSKDLIQIFGFDKQTIFQHFLIKNLFYMALKVLETDKFK